MHARHDDVFGRSIGSASKWDRLIVPNSPTSGAVVMTGAALGEGVAAMVGDAVAAQRPRRASGVMEGRRAKLSDTVIGVHTPDGKV